MMLLVPRLMGKMKPARGFFGVLQQAPDSLEVVLDELPGRPLTLASTLDWRRRR